MMNHSRRLRNCFPILVLAVSCNLLLASGLEQQRSVDYRRNRVRIASESETNLRQAATATDTATGTRNLSNRRRRTRGSVGGKPQNQRELGKSGSKSGGSSSGGGSSGGSSSGGSSSGGSSSGGSSSGGSSSGGSSSGGSYSEASYADNGSYIGCLGNNNAYANYGFDTHGVSCDFTVTQNSYGYGQRDPNPDNSQSYVASYFKYNRLVEWQVVEEPESDYFTEYGYHNDEWESVYGDNYEGRDNDGDEYQDAYQEEVVVVEEAGGDYDPYLAFDIGKCDTYSRLWTYDLFDSCAYGKENCECTYALKLMEMDLLTCSDAKDCPSQCGVCSQCLHSICDQYLPTQLIANEVKTPAGFALAAVFGTVALAAWVTHEKNKPKRGNKLMDEEGTSYTAKNWSIPVGKDGLPTEGTTKKSKPVWLAPDVSTIKRKPLFPDVLKNDHDGVDDASSVVEMRVAPRPIKKAKPEAPKKKRSSKRHQGPVIVTSSDVSIPSSLSWNGGDSDSDSDHGEI